MRPLRLEKKRGGGGGRRDIRAAAKRSPIFAQ